MVNSGRTAFIDQHSNQICLTLPDRHLLLDQAVQASLTTGAQRRRWLGSASPTAAAAAHDGASMQPELGACTHASTYPLESAVPLAELLLHTPPQTGSD